MHYILHNYDRFISGAHRIPISEDLKTYISLPTSRHKNIKKSR